MKGIKIIAYQPEYYDRLYSYMKKKWPRQSREYLDYRLKTIVEDNKDLQYNLLILNEKGEIVGCNLFFPTKALIRGKERRVYWSHDTILDKEYRGDGGLMFMLKLQSQPHFGMGLSTVNRKIQQALKTTFFREMVIYYRLNLFFITSIFQYVTQKRPVSNSFIHPTEVKVGKGSFLEVKDIASLKMPDKGYWCQGDVDIDFIRDHGYLSKRFMCNFNTYYMYRLSTQKEYDSCYMVVRPVLKKKTPVLSIVDFRYDLKSPGQFLLILKAANRIAKVNKIGIVLCLCNIKYGNILMKLPKVSIISLFPLLLRRNKGVDYVASSSSLSQQSASSLVTSADSDADFLCQSIN